MQPRPAGARHPVVDAQDQEAPVGLHTAPRPHDLLVRRLAVPGTVTAAAVTVLAGAGAGVASAHDGQGGHGGHDAAHGAHGQGHGPDAHGQGHESDDASDDGADTTDPALCDVAGDLGGMGTDLFGDTCASDGETQDGDGADPSAPTPAAAPATGPAAAPSPAPGAAPSSRPIRPVASTDGGTSGAGSTALDRPGAPGTTRTTPIR